MSSIISAASRADTGAKRRLVHTMPEPLLTYRGTVYPWHCDHVGHMNVMWYVGKFDEATWQMFAAIGLTPAFLSENHMVIAAVRQEIVYRHELFPGDLISIRTAVLDIKTLRLRFYHEMVKDESGVVAAATVITGVLLDSGTRKPTTFPPQVMEMATTLTAQVTLLM